jgi:K+-sensing histidine kinase KdpD
MRATPQVQARERRKADAHFASAERVPSAALLAQAERVARHPVIEAVLDAVTGYVLLLDRRRQILAVNNAFVTALGRTSAAELIGMRPGEALGCENAKDGPSGCGTASSCRQCGTALSLAAAQGTDNPIFGHCLIKTNREKDNGCSEFAVRVKKVTLEGDDFWVCVLVDVTVTRRREMLERLFLHDSRNVLMGLLGWGEWLNQVQPSEAAEQIVNLTRRLAREIDEQQWLMQAELGTLQIQTQNLRIRSVLDTVSSVFGANECAKERDLEVDCGCSDDFIVTDERLLIRVLVNMVQNAIEATPSGGRVALRVAKSALGYRFVVCNPGEVPAEVARQLFHVRFSTKGELRGLGTHALRLFGEGCLGGKISFETDPREGTRFCFELPQGQIAQER